MDETRCRCILLYLTPCPYPHWRSSYFCNYNYFTEIQSILLLFKICTNTNSLCDPSLVSVGTKQLLNLVALRSLSHPLFGVHLLKHFNGMFKFFYVNSMTSHSCAAHEHCRDIC